MKRKFLPCSLLCMFLAATTAFGNPGDTFYEANLSLTRAARQEKEGDYKAALESGKKAAQLLQSLKISEPEWNPEWVAGKLDAAAQLQRRQEQLNVLALCHILQGRPQEGIGCHAARTPQRAAHASA